MSKPMSDARREQLVAQMAKAREARAEKRLTEHVCTPAPLEVAWGKLQKQLDQHTEGNIAPIPVALHYEAEERLWFVMIHVRIPHVTEYEVEASAFTLADAISSAAQGLSHQYILRRSATRDGEVFGYTF